MPQVQGTSGKTTSVLLASTPEVEARTAESAVRFADLATRVGEAARTAYRGLVETEGWRAVLRRFPPRRYPPEANFAHVAWLHRFLDRLATTGFPAPRPLRVLNDDSMAIVDGAIWEVLSYVPGRALMWDPAVPVESAGSLLARFHQASLAISPADQRPGALPLDECHPLSAKSIARRPAMRRF